MNLYQNLIDQEMISRTLQVILLCNYPITHNKITFLLSCSVGDSLWQEIQPNLLFSSEEDTQLSSLLFSLSVDVRRLFLSKHNILKFFLLNCCLRLHL